MKQSSITRYGSKYGSKLLQGLCKSAVHYVDRNLHIEMSKAATCALDKTSPWIRNAAEVFYGHNKVIAEKRAFVLSRFCLLEAL